MPLANFSEGLRNVVMFLPGTYGTSLLRNHTLNGVFEEMTAQLAKENPSYVVEEVIKGLKNSIDCNIYFFDAKVSVGTMYLVLAIAIAVLIAVYVLINVLSKNKN